MPAESSTWPHSLWKSLQQRAANGIMTALPCVDTVEQLQHLTRDASRPRAPPAWRQLAVSQGADRYRLDSRQIVGFPACARSRRRLLDRDGGSGALEGFLRLLGSILGDFLQDGFRSTLDEVLGFLEPKAREGAHLLDDLDLLVTG